MDSRFSSTSRLGGLGGALVDRLVNGFLMLPNLRLNVLDDAPSLRLCVSNCTGNGNVMQTDLNGDAFVLLDQVV